MLEIIEGLTYPFNQKLPFRELRRGDLINASGVRCVIVEIDGEGISVLLPDGGECGLEAGPQVVLRRIPDELEEWVFLSLREAEPIRCYALENCCWKCGFVGRAVALSVGSYLVTDGASVFRYPGVRRQLREFFATRPDVRAGFGAVRKRFSKTTGRSDISQGCRQCDALWGAFPLSELFRVSVTDLQAGTESGKVIPAFEVETGKLFDEGGLPWRETAGARRTGGEQR